MITKIKVRGVIHYISRTEIQRGHTISKSFSTKKYGQQEAKLRAEIADALIGSELENFYQSIHQARLKCYSVLYEFEEYVEQVKKKFEEDALKTNCFSIEIQILASQLKNHLESSLHIVKIQQAIFQKSSEERVELLEDLISDEILEEIGGHNRLQDICFRPLVIGLKEYVVLEVYYV